MQQDPQSTTWFFLGPVATAYLVAAALWLAYDWRYKLCASEPPLEESDHSYWDLLLTVVTAAGIFLFGEVYRRDWLLPAGSTPVGRLGWFVDNLIIFSPIAVVLAVRRQSPRTVFLSPTRLPEKIGLGLALGVIAVTLYSALRGEVREVPGYLVSALSPNKIVDFFPVFMEGVAVAFAFVRLRWVTGTALAILIPSLLFAAAHVPGSLAEGRDWGYIAIFFAFNT